MPVFTVMRRGESPVSIEADNWIAAMGAGIARLDEDVGIDRLACEMLPNGTVIARDVRTGVAYIILPNTKATDSVSNTTPTNLLDSIDESEPSLDEAAGAVLNSEELKELLIKLRDTRSPVEAWDLTLASATRLIDVEAGTAVEATPHAGLLFVSVYGSEADTLRAMTLPYGTGLVGFCIDSCTTLIVNDVTGDDRHYSGVDEATGFHTRSALVVPISNATHVFGCIELLNPTSPFTRQDVDLLECLCVTLSKRLTRAGVHSRQRR